jgi:hypothetical protein
LYDKAEAKMGLPMGTGQAEEEKPSRFEEVIDSAKTVRQELES